MRPSTIIRLFKSRELRAAWAVAIAADSIQILALPLFAAGGFSPADMLIDLAVALILARLLGWHWAFLPTLVAELVPGLDLFPTWTASVFYVSCQLARATEPGIYPEHLASRRSLNS
ncbi:MAG TPA: hypothetical protein VER98_18725 [Terriglobia bacterium]|nr:hypothetical protein [Terriglobia bacterium]